MAAAGRPSDSHPEPHSGPAAAAAVRAYLVGALLMYDEGRHDELRDALRRRAWQHGVDLSQIHGMLLELTDHLLASCLGALVSNRPAEAREALEEALARWTDASDA
jgi:hypothetical protein